MVSDNAMAKLEFFFDCSSPWTYLAAVGVRQLAEELSIQVDAMVTFEAYWGLVREAVLSVLQ